MRTTKLTRMSAVPPVSLRGHRNPLTNSLIFGALFALCALPRVHAQAKADAPVAEADKDVLVLTPFEVTASADSKGYTAATTLAGNRLKTDLRDVGSSVSV